MTSIVLKNATIVTLDDHMHVHESAELLMIDGKISEIGREVTVPEGAKVIDASGCAVMPGFVQTHVHLCQALMRNNADDMVLIDWLKTRIWPYEAALRPEELRASADLALSELILGGTTSLLDMGTVNHTDAIGEAVKDSGIRAFIGKCMMDLGDEVPKPMMERRDESLKESLRLQAYWDGAEEGRIRYAFCPRFAVSCTDGMLRDVVAAAADVGAFIHTHASETEYENEFTQELYGMSNMAYLESIGMMSDHSVFAHGVHVSHSDCTALARTGTAIAHCPSANLKLGSGIANLPQYDEMGVKVYLGADGAPCNNNMDAFVEMRLAALLQKPFHGPTAMPAERVLRLATRDGAVALGIDDITGTLEVGKMADVVVVNLDDDPGTNPGGNVYSRLVYASHRANVRHVFASGRQLVDNGVLVGMDLGAILHRSRTSLASVVERM